jgi:hypothetical protein
VRGCLRAVAARRALSRARSELACCAMAAISRVAGTTGCLRVVSPGSCTDATTGVESVARVCDDPWCDDPWTTNTSTITGTTSEATPIHPRRKRREPLRSRARAGRRMLRRRGVRIGALPGGPAACAGVALASASRRPRSDTSTGAALFCCDPIVGVWLSVNAAARALGGAACAGEGSGRCSEVPPGAL